MSLKRLCRRLMAAGLCLGAGLAFSAQAAGANDAYPDRPISIVVPFPAGGTTDSLARLLGNKIAEEWKQTVVVENRPGAAGMIGATQVARAKPDGYTFMITITSLIHAPSLYKNVQYDPVKDFVPVALLTRTAPTLVVRSDMPVSNVKEFVELVRKDPTKYGTLGNYGTGSLAHIYASLLDRQAKLGVTHIPYKGAAPLTIDILGGQVAAGLSDYNTVLPHVKSGRLKVLAVTGADRVPMLPDAPSMTELGFEDFEAYGWLGMFAPTGTPPAIVAKAATTVEGILKRADVREALLGLGIDAEQNSTQPEFEKMVARDFQTWAKLIKDANIQLD